MSDRKPFKGANAPKKKPTGVFHKPVTRHDTPPVFTTPIKKATPYKPPLVQYVPDKEYGTELKLVNGVPISFKKLPELRPVKKNTRTRSSSDDDPDEMEGY